MNDKLIVPLQLSWSLVHPEAKSDPEILAKQNDEEEEEEDHKQGEPEASEPSRRRSARALAKVQGHASVFDLVDLGGDIVRHGAFLESIKATGGRVPLFWEHSHSLPGKGDSMPVGVTVKLEEDSHGLFFEGKIANTSKGRDLIALMDTVGMRSSIGFELVKENIQNNNGSSVRELLELSLMEISIVTFPMNPAATARVVKSDSIEDTFAAGVDRLVAISGG
jgi:HK97 family phage prohead protease